MDRKEKNNNKKRSLRRKSLAVLVAISAVLIINTQTTLATLPSSVGSTMITTNSQLADQSEAGLKISKASKPLLLPVSSFGDSSPINSSGTCGVDVGTSILKCPNDEGIMGMLLEISQFVFAGVGILCLIGISIGGIIYATAGGDTSKTKQGISYIVNALIALAVFVFLFVLLNFMVPGGFFNNAGLDTGAADPVYDPTNTNPGTGGGKCGGVGQPVCAE